MTKRKVEKRERTNLMKAHTTPEDIIKKCAREVIRKNRKVFDELAKY